VQTCSRCNMQSPDTALICSNCQADLGEFSTFAVSLKNMQDNPRVKMIRVSVAADACPACQQAMGAYEKDRVPTLPVEGCSHPNGCRCFHDPILDEIYP
jgi:hypothetical protein